MKRWLREPLLHFLVIGALLFAVYAWLDRGQGDTPRVVHISAAEINWLKETWTRQWHRPPDAQDLRGLVTAYLKEELLAREAKELGLDQDDTVVRRRLAQKMEFMVQDTATVDDPTDSVLHQFYDSHRSRYERPPQISFSQIYFRSEPGAQHGLTALKTHRSGEVGDPSLLAHDYKGVDKQTLTSLFGDNFSRAVFDLDSGVWRGPVASGYGFHLVKVNARNPAQQLSFESVRTKIRNDWQRVQQDKAERQFYARLLKKYDVVVDEGIQPVTGPLAAVAP